MERKVPYPLAVMLLLNLIPLLGVLYWNWTIFYVIYLYWFESLLLALFNALRILFAKGKTSHTDSGPWQALGSKVKTEPKSNLGIAVSYFIKRVLLLLFYFIFVLVFAGFIAAPDTASGLDAIRIIAFADPGFNRVILVFALSQLLDFGYNYILNKENEHTHPYDLSALFDARTIVIHVVIVLGGVVSVHAQKEFGEAGHRYGTWTYVIVFIIVKTVADAIAYNRDRSKARKASEAHTESA